MSMDGDDSMYVVVLNDEEQYSIWPAHRAVPPGWRSLGEARQKAECLRHIDEYWTDLRPRSLREHLAATRG